MKLFEKCKYIGAFIKHGIYFFDKQNNPCFEKDRIMGEILRNTHSIEKGLSLENIRNGFGMQKIAEARNLINRYMMFENASIIPVKMFVSALNAYLNYHQTIGYEDDNVKNVRAIYEELSSKYTKSEEDYGGVLQLRKKEITQEGLETIKELFYERHSMREFDGSAVDMHYLKEAIELAMHCPSACNRQGYRVHIVHKSAFDKLNHWMDGIGGFANDIDKLLIITANLSVYRLSEPYQHVVTSTVFASYLSLALQAYNIGCCFVQRNVTPNIKWSVISKQFNIPTNEEVVCCLGIGNLKKEYKVPRSYRLPYETIVSEIK